MDRDQRTILVGQREGKLRVGSVSFLNAKPLIYGLDQDPAVSLSLAVPSRLLDGLLANQLDVALLPVIDYQRMEGLRLLTSGGIACDGPTLTVRLFSPVPLEQTRVVACDRDSHTSVALARVIFARRFGLQPKFVDLDLDHPPVDAVRLLIGDKVVCDEPKHLMYQLDLGQAWKEMTGQPFVFACWMARAGVELGDLPAKLEQAKQQGLEHVEELIERYAKPNGWPAEIARQYLTHYLKFDIGPLQIDAIRRFHHLAYELGALKSPPRPILSGDIVGAFNLTHVAK